MKYLFFDIECADGGKGTICSFGYIITDENFKILRREDIIINPQGRFNLTGRAGRPDIILAYPMETFKRAPTFDHFYSKIKMLLENEDYTVVGHSVGDDVTYLNKACARYSLEPLSFRFFDTQRMYRAIKGEKNSISLERAFENLTGDEKFRAHQSVEDARATMFVLKALLEQTGMGFLEYAASTDQCTGKTEGGEWTWDYLTPMSEQLHSVVQPNGKNNTIRHGKRNHTFFMRYIESGKPLGEKSDKLAGKKVSVSMNYESRHFKEMLLLVGMIKAAGGEYTVKSSDADVFATYNVTNENGEPRFCTRLQYAKEAIASGRQIEIVTLDELLSLLGTSTDELESTALPDMKNMFLA